MTKKKNVEITDEVEIKDENIDKNSEEIKTIEVESVEDNGEEKNQKTHRVAIIIISILMILGIGTSLYFMFFTNNSNVSNSKVKPKPDKKLPKLPKPELAEGERGQLGIDKNVNEKAIDKYLNRDDSVYRDMRMLVDPAEYENIGGDRFLSGYVKGFEVVPLPYIIPVDNLPEEVGETHTGETLFFKMSDGTYAPNYEESMDIIEELFPRDKIIFLMCGGGGYAGMMKQFLVSQGWDEDYIYVVGGYWYYRGKNDVKVPTKSSNSKTPEYDFSSVPYHEIDFAELTEIMPDRHNKGDVEPFYLEDLYYGNKDETFDELMKKLNSAYTDYSNEHKKYDSKEYTKFFEEREQKVIDYINKLMKDKKSFVITTYNDLGCGDGDDTIRTKALDFFENNKIYTYDLGFETLMKTDVYKDVKNAPNCIIFKNGKVYTFYYDESDEDLKINESKQATAEWIKKYIKLKD